MSWTKRLTHPSEILNLGDEIEVVVLNVNKQKQEISLGLKQTEPNPWTVASQKYPVGTIVSATVRSLTNFGVFVEIERGIDGMIHISDLSWTKKYGHPSEALQKGQEIKCVVLEVNEQKQRVSLGIKQMTEDPWARAIPEKYIPGQIIKGTVTKLTNFGAFVELEPDLEGLLHISELADHKIEKPQDIVKLGEEIEVKILRVDTEARKIGLSLRRVRWAAEEQASKSDHERTATDIKTVPSDIDTSQAEKPQDKAGTISEPGPSPQQTAEDQKHSKGQLATPEAPKAGAGDAEQDQEIDKLEQIQHGQTQDADSQAKAAPDSNAEEKADN